MESNHITYDYIKSFDRIDDIISTSDNSFEELNEIPSRDKLTYTNGFYVNCSALFVDIRNSSELPKKHTRPKLAKLYRVFLSEIVAIINGNDSCAEINIEGDSVSGIFNTPYQLDIKKVFNSAAEISSLIDIINCKFKKKNIEQIEVGIGLSYGRALMVKAGYNGSGINDIVWMGDVVNEASKLSSYGNQTLSDREVMVSKAFYENLSERCKELLSYNYFRSCYHGEIVWPEMDAWYQENCRNSDSNTFSFFT
jgi:class 3 adenylate cyclase